MMSFHRFVISCYQRSTEQVYYEYLALSMCVTVAARLFQSQKRAKQETNGKQRLSIKDAHLLGNVGDAEEIKQG
jgi:hypothetical protein